MSLMDCFNLMICQPSEQVMLMSVPQTVLEGFFWSLALVSSLRVKFQSHWRIQRGTLLLPFKPVTLKPFDDHFCLSPLNQSSESGKGHHSHDVV